MLPGEGSLHLPFCGETADEGLAQLVVMLLQLLAVRWSKMLP